MKIRLGTLVIASLASVFALGAGVASAEPTRAERSLDRVLGLWINSHNGAKVKFFWTSNRPKVRVKAAPDIYEEGGYSAAEEGGDIVVTFPPNKERGLLKCYLDVNPIASSDPKKIALSVRGSNLGSARECAAFEGIFERLPDSE